MVRQPKVRAQAPLGFLADDRGAAPTGRGHGADWLRNAASRPSRRTAPTRPVEMAMHPRLGFSEGTDYYNTGKMGDELGHRNSARSDAGS